MPGRLPRRCKRSRRQRVKTAAMPADVAEADVAAVDVVAVAGSRAKASLMQLL